MSALYPQNATFRSTREHVGFSVDSNEECHLLEHSDISWAPGLPLATLVPAHTAGKGCSTCTSLKYSI